MAGAFVGSLLLMGSSTVFSWPVKLGSAPVSAEEERQAAFDSPAGSCLTWTPPDGTDMKRVDCAQPHLFEVTSNVDITGDYPPDVAPPDLARWQQIAKAKCTPGVTAYLGGKLDPFGKYTVNALKPSEAQWQDGDRKLRCGVQRTTPSGGLLTSTGSAADADQSNVHEPGTCLALDNQKIGDPLPCDQEHAYEIVGTVDLGSAFPGDSPTKDAQLEKAGELCVEVTNTYTGGTDLAAKGLTPYADALEPESWAAGSRKVDCKVGARLADGSGLAPVTNSVRGTPTESTAPTTTTPAPTTTPTG
ncbi:septum formation family protein [Actinokineospora auranticolor]|uniref:Putative regulator of septum formation n=1 Tax=Actinokineospora auranticolor TaxID=155976 RepID=A0A2S6GLB3_9PSEU|nr:septum formation family protein [Actinokineospora auranticolor]PPK65963.1 putative regulator of septum formation [Actinokineospora auranticolor]